MKKPSTAFTDATIERAEKRAIQAQFAKEHDAPMFAPTARCWSCGKNIWDAITLKRAGSELITSCPYCHRSYCD